ncbi:MAG: pectinesterase family protein [Clostridia bacterium]
MPLTLTISNDGQGDFRSLQAAVDSIPEHNQSHICLLLKSGVHREKVILNRDCVELIGEDGAVLVYGDCAVDRLEDGSARGAFLTATLLVTGRDVCLRNLTIQNDAELRCEAGAAIALYAAGDRLTCYHCRLLGAHNTLYCGPMLWRLARHCLPHLVPLGVENAVDRPPVNARQHYADCYFQGEVDCIFGPYRCWFERCTLHARKGGGCFTAASTPEGQPYGFVFHTCKLEGDCARAEMYLGHPWREHAAVAFLECEMDACIHPLGFCNGIEPFQNVTRRLCEFGSTGAGADTNARHPDMKLIRREEACRYTPKAVFGGRDGWLPS